MLNALVIWVYIESIETWIANVDCSLVSLAVCNCSLNTFILTIIMSIFADSALNFIIFNKALKVFTAIRDYLKALDTISAGNISISTNLTFIFLRIECQTILNFIFSLMAIVNVIQVISINALITSSLKITSWVSEASLNFFNR